VRKLLPFLLLLGGCAGAPAGPRVQDWQGQHSAVPAVQALVVQDAAAWDKLWLSIEKPAPAADLGTHFAVGVFLGDKRPGEYLFGWSYKGDGKTLTVGYQVARRDANSGWTRPYAVFLFPRSLLGPGMEVRVEDQTPGGAHAL
jgi:hypothetical protein